MRKRWLRSVACGAGLLGALTLAGPVPAVATADRLAEFYHQPVTWSACDGMPNAALECASIVVPMDYRHPEAARVTVAISRLPAAEPHRRHGALLLNPGGPGGSGLGLPAQFADRPIARAYDLVGFDPRGVGRSTPLRCERPPSTGTVTSRPSDEEFAVWVANAQAEEEGCQRAGGELRPFVNTPNTARDMDVIRGVLGESRINFLGFSYGTYLGAVYGTLFPTRLHRSVLDSAVHPDRLWREQGKHQAVAARESVLAWADWTGRRHDTYGLGHSGSEVMANVEALAARLRAAPVIVDGTTIDLTTYDVLLGARAQRRPLWGELSGFVATIRQVSTGAPAVDARAAVDAVRPVRAPQPASAAATVAGVFQAVTCEADWPRDPETYYADMRLYRERYPYALGVLRAAPKNCAFRGFTPPEPVVRPHRSYPPGLVVHGTADANTSYDGAVALAALLRNPLVPVLDDGNHAQYLTNACVQQLVDRYLIEGALPAPGTTCAGEPRPNVPADGTGPARPR
jgi:pimeloyl-ACP methyl ester carboxylesterase